MASTSYLDEALFGNSYNTPLEPMETRPESYMDLEGLVDPTRRWCFHTLCGFVCNTQQELDTHDIQMHSQLDTQPASNSNQSVFRAHLRYDNNGVVAMPSMPRFALLTPTQYGVQQNTMPALDAGFNTKNPFPAPDGNEQNNMLAFNAGMNDNSYLPQYESQQTAGPSDDVLMADYSPTESEQKVWLPTFDGSLELPADEQPLCNSPSAASAPAATSSTASTPFFNRRAMDSTFTEQLGSDFVHPKQLADAPRPPTTAAALDTGYRPAASEHPFGSEFEQPQTTPAAPTPPFDLGPVEAFIAGYAEPETGIAVGLESQQPENTPATTSPPPTHAPAPVPHVGYAVPTQTPQQAVPQPRQRLPKILNGDRHVCPWTGCDKDYSTAQQLQIHFDAKHNGMLQQCDEPGCNVHFTDPSNKRTHMKRHKGTDKQDYTCQYCGIQKRCRRDNFVRHEKNCSQNPNRGQ